MIHASYKSLFVAIAIAMLGVGCAVPAETEEGQAVSDLTVEQEQLKPQAATPGSDTTITSPTKASPVVRPIVPHVLAAGPKPNPWDDNSTNTDTNSTSGTSGSGTSK